MTPRKAAILAGLAQASGVSLAKVNHPIHHHHHHHRKLFQREAKVAQPNAAQFCAIFQSLLSQVLLPRVSPKRFDHLCLGCAQTVAESILDTNERNVSMGEDGLLALRDGRARSLAIFGRQQRGRTNKKTPQINDLRGFLRGVLDACERLTTYFWRGRRSNVRL